MALRLVFAIISVFLVLTGYAQPRLDKLSPEERIELAERENMEASTDPTFLNLMDQAHQLFRERHYLKAIRAYESAQQARPNNVYPKVKIADIELSMKDTLAQLRAEEKREQQNNAQAFQLPEREQPKARNLEAEQQQEAERLKLVEQWERGIRGNTPDPPKQEEQPHAKPQNTNADVVQLTEDDMQRELAENYPPGITERVYQDGSRKVTSRVVVKDGKGNEYKKVEHGWGGRFYFKNGSPISEGTWQQEAF